MHITCSENLSLLDSSSVLQTSSAPSTQCFLNIQDSLWESGSQESVFSFCLHIQVSWSSRALPPPPSYGLSFHNHHSKLLKEIMAIYTCPTAKHFVDAAFLGGGGRHNSQWQLYYNSAFIYTMPSKALFSTLHDCTTAYTHIFPFTDDKPHELSCSK